VDVRRQGAVLAVAGAAVLGLGCWLPYSSQSGVEYEVFQRHGGVTSQLYYAIETAGVMILAAVAGLMLLAGGVPRLLAGALVATGGQTVLMWAGYVGTL
jgi:hypothetical protein